MLAPASLPLIRVAVTLADDFSMTPSTVSVRAGVSVTFVVTNGGAVAHEFYLGDEAAQLAHDSAMMTMPGTMTDEADGISVEPTQTRELSHTFDAAGSTIAGCHVSGHYAAGMKMTITVTS